MEGLDSQEFNVKFLIFSEKTTFWGQDLEFSPEVWIILVFSVVLFWILLAIFLTCFCGPNFVECQLCEQQVFSFFWIPFQSETIIFKNIIIYFKIPRNQWTKPDHRDNCAKEHERFLSELKKITVRCPRCLARYIILSKF